MKNYKRELDSSDESNRFGNDLIIFLGVMELVNGAKYLT